jgi:ABC-type spermidine/putrescine transport system permease subunit II
MDVPLNVRLTRTIRHELERAAADLGAPSLNWLINRLLADSLEVRSR